MTQQTYWRGYIDAQGKKDIETDNPMASAKTSKALRPLAELLDVSISSYRSGFFIPVGNIDKKLPQKFDADYLRGWFKAQGQRYKGPLKLTVTAKNIETFLELVQKHLGMDLPKPQKPSKTSKSMRVTVTGDKAKALDDFLRAS